MPVMRYRTDYPNQVHQLLITVSRHLYVLKNGEFSYQKKPFEFDLRNVNKSAKTHFIHYFLKDHYSGVFYVEMCTQFDLIPVDEFLFRAWSKKEDTVFCGIPDIVIVPKSVQEFGPGISSLLKALQVKQIEPNSGYQAGVKEISFWEKEIRIAPVFDAKLKSFAALRRSTSQLIGRMIRSGRDKKSRVEKWNEKIDKVYLPTDLHFFKDSYSSPAPRKEHKPLGKLMFLVDDSFEEVEGRFEWGDERDELFQRFYDADELIDDGYAARAKSRFKKIIDEDPEFIDAYNSLGFLEMDAGKYKKALPLLQKGFDIGNKLLPHDFAGKIIWSFLDNRPFLRSMHGLGVCHLKLGDIAKANNIFVQMLNYNPNDNQGIRALSIESNLALKRYSVVLSICDKYPDDTLVDTLFGRVLALYKLGKEQEAALALDEAIKCRPLVAKELIKKHHPPVYGDMPGWVTGGGADEAYDYWDRVGKYWIENPETLDFVRKRLMLNGMIKR